ncbi:MAG: hypothetical protein DHS20C18_10590 [Saprospiraceae bacterium]|nr:MAG: hypothetical protein DHS20C18_10590 [Saprospiraceae bacterium]
MTLGVSGLAQVTIDESNYLRLSTYTDSLIDAITPTSLALPSEGPNQVWDYSALVADETILTDHFGVDNDADFPGATSYYQNNLTFQGLIIPSYTYEAVDETGWSVIGSANTEVSYSITFLTGGPTDTLRFPGGNYLNEGENLLLDFPMAWQNQWTSQYVQNTPYELTIAAFGLDKVPGVRQRMYTANHEVVGYGELIIPTSDGTPSAPMEVLLMKAERIAVDSIFLGGAPAPAPLLTAFGLTQGGTISVVSYLFYKPGFGSAVLAVDEDEPSFYTYRPQAAAVSTGIAPLHQVEFNCFPNPAQAGQLVTIENENLASSGQVNIVDVQGRIMHTIAYETSSKHQLQLSIPDTFEEGLYFYQIYDDKGTQIGRGKLLVK